MTVLTHRPVRIGAVSYLNSKPLIEGLEELAPETELLVDYPSRLADHLADGSLDVALIPSVECLLNPDYEIISDACVAARGAVLSVKLYSRVPIAEIGSLALDEGSRTSSALTRIMLWERFGIEPNLEQLPLGLSTDATAADAVLLIGDRAMHRPRETFVATWDLGEEWVKWTGLPFVFALWAARSGSELENVREILCRARDRGCEQIERIGRQEAPLLGIAEQTAIDYLKKNLHFRYGLAEQSGLKLFYRLAVKLGLAHAGVELVFRDCAPA